MQDKFSYQVAGYNNNCGLYALALGIKLAFQTNPLLGAQYPKLWEMLNGYESIIFQQHVAGKTSKVGKMLRAELSSALKSNASYQYRCLVKFIALSNDHLSGKDSPPDMEAFVKSNPDYFSNLGTEWVQKRDTFAPFLVSLKDDLVTQDFSRQKVDKNFLKILHLIHDKMSNTEIDHLFFDNKPISFDRLVYLKFQYNIFSATDFVIDSVERGHKKYLFEEILLQCSAYHMNQAENEDNLPLLVQLSFLNNHNTDYRKKLSVEELEAIVLNFFCASQTHKNWDEIYPNYCNYVQNNKVMITASELMVLATNWKLSLRIFFSNTEFNSNEIIAPLQVDLHNRSLDHWETLTSNQQSGYQTTNHVIIEKPTEQVQLVQLQNSILSLSTHTIIKLCQQIDISLRDPNLLFPFRFDQNNFNFLQPIFRHFSDVTKIPQDHFIKQFFDLYSSHIDQTAIVLETNLLQLTLVINNLYHSIFVSPPQNRTAPINNFLNDLCHLKMAVCCYLLAISDGLKDRKKISNCTYTTRLDQFINKHDFFSLYLPQAKEMYEIFQQLKNPLAQIAATVESITYLSKIENWFGNNDIEIKTNFYRLMIGCLQNKEKYIEHMYAISSLFEMLNAILNYVKLRFLNLFSTSLDPILRMQLVEHSIPVLALMEKLISKTKDYHFTIVSFGSGKLDIYMQNIIPTAPAHVAYNPNNASQFFTTPQIARTNQFLPPSGPSTDFSFGT